MSRFLNWRIRTRNSSSRKARRNEQDCFRPTVEVLEDRIVLAVGLYGSDVADDGLITIDTSTGSGSFVGNFGGSHSAVGGLAYDSNTDTLYGIDSTTASLVTIDRTTGVATAVGPVGPPLTVSSASGLAFDPNTDTLYWADGGINQKLYTVDTTTGAATQIAAFPPAPLGQSIGALAFDPNTNTLYGVDGGSVSIGTNASDTLYTIDTTTAALTAVGPTGVAGDFSGLAFDPVANTLYWGDTTTDNLYTLNTSTGAATLVGPFGSYGLFPDSFVFGLAFESPAAPTLSINDVTVNETAGTATLTVSVDTPPAFDVTFNYFTSPGTAIEGQDYTGGAAAGMILSGSLTTTINVPILDDILFERDETFFVDVTNVVGAAIADGQGVVTIQDDEQQPTLSINDVTVNEGDGSAAPTVSLSGPSAFDVMFDFATADGTAIDGLDYTAANVTRTILAGTTTTFIPVGIFDDALFEVDETFFVNLSNSVGATFADAQGLVTIQENDPPPTLFIDNAIVNEGDAAAALTVSLTGASALNITFDFATADGTALDGLDYTGGIGAGTIPAGSFTTTINVPILEDPIFEGDEQLFVNLSNAVGATIGDGQAFVTIQDNDPPPNISINDVTVNEGDAVATLTVSVDTPPPFDVTFDYTTVDGTATAGPGQDYTAVAAAGMILSGSLTTTITVPILDDATFEGNETFFVDLSNVVGAAISDGQGIVTIVDNDPPPVDCNVVQRGDGLVVLGDNGDNQFAITYQAGTAHVICDGSDAGQFFGIVAINVDAQGGNDTIELDVVGGGTPDNTRPAEFNVFGGAGADAIRVDVDAVSGIEPQPFRLLVNGNGGADDIDVIAKVGQVSGVDPDPFIPEIRVLGGAGADAIRVDVGAVSGISPEPFRLLVNGNGGPDDIAVVAKIGQVSGITPEPFVPEISVLGGEGGDTIGVEVDAVSGVDPEPFRLFVDGGGGADDIDVFAKIGQIAGISPEPFIPDLTVLGGAEADAISVGIESVSGIDPQPFHLTVNGQGGGDTVSVVARMGQVSGVTPEPFIPKLNVLGGVGADVISVGIEPVSGIDPEPFRLFVDGGDGADTIGVVAKIGQVSGVTPDPFIPELNVLGGAGTDVISVGIEPVSGIDPDPFRLFVDGEGGDDSIGVVAKIGQVSGITPDPFIPELNVLGGAGADTIRVDVDAVSGIDPEPFRLFVDGGGGPDTIEASFEFGASPSGAGGLAPVATAPVINADIEMRGGAGADTIRADFHNVPGNIRFDANTGFGDDSLDLGIHGFNPQPEPPLFKPAEFNVFGGPGQDVMAVEFEPSLAIPVTPIQLLVNGGFGADTIGVVAKIGQSSGITPDPFMPVMNVLGGAGADTISVGIEPVSGVEPEPFRLFVDGGIGADAIAASFEFGASLSAARGLSPVATAPVINADIEIRGGAGRDTIRSRVEVPPNATGRLSVAVHGNRGDDDLELAVFGTDAIDELFLLLDGGAGFDTGRATSNVLVEAIEDFELIR